MSSTTLGHHNLKYGVDLKANSLAWRILASALPIPAYNSPCVSSDGCLRLANARALNSSSAMRRRPDFEPNTANNPMVTGAPFSPALLPFEPQPWREFIQIFMLRRISTNMRSNVQDGITLGHLSINIGFPWSQYDGLSTNTGPQPAHGAGLQHQEDGNGFCGPPTPELSETPFNENLLLSSAKPEQRPGSERIWFGPGADSSPVIRKPVQHGLSASHWKVRY